MIFALRVDLVVGNRGQARSYKWCNSRVSHHLTVGAGLTAIIPDMAMQIIQPHDSIIP